MKRLVQLLITLLFAATSMWVQATDGPKTTIGNAIVSAPASIEIPVIVSDFNNVGSFGLKLNFNKNLLTYNGITGGAFTGILGDNPSDGVVTLAWFLDTGQPSGKTLSNGATLVKIKFNVISSGSTALSWNDTGNTCEYTDYPLYTPFNDSPASTFYDNGSIIASGLIDIGIYNLDCDDFAVKCKSAIGVVDGAFTNIQFTVKWPVTSPNASLILASSPIFGTSSARVDSAK